MSIDLNMDIGELVKNLLKGGSKAKGSTPDNTRNTPGNPLLKSIVTYCLVIILTIASYIYFSYIPEKQKVDNKNEEMRKILSMQREIDILNAQINALKKQIDTSKEQYFKKLAMFGNSEDLGQLYQSFSNLASKYNLTILNIHEIKAPKTAPAQTDGGEPAQHSPKQKIYETKVEVEIRGRYTEYIAFKEDLAVAEMLLTINSETIETGRIKESNDILARLNLSTYAIDKSSFDGVIQ